MGAVGTPPARTPGQAAWFTLDLSADTVTARALPPATPRRGLRDRFVQISADPVRTELFGGTLRHDMLAAGSSFTYGTLTFPETDFTILHAVDLRHGSWSTQRLTAEESVTAWHVDENRTAYALTSRLDLWNCSPGGRWRRAPLRRRLARLLAQQTGTVQPSSGRITHDRILLTVNGTVLTCALDGTATDVLYRFDDDVSDVVCL